MASRIPTCDIDKTFIWLIWVVPWRNCKLIITIFTINNNFISIHICCRWNILLTWFNHWSSVNKCISCCISVICHYWFIISRNSRWIQYIDFSYCWTIISYDFTNTFYVIMSTSSLQLSKLSTNRASKFTRCSWSICLLVQDITFKWTWIWSRIVLTLETCLCIWSKFSFITSWFITLSSCVCTWTWRIISRWSCINYFIVSCLIHLSWWHTNFNVRFRFTLVSRCQIVINLFCFQCKRFFSIILDNDIDCRSTTTWSTIICRSIINKVRIVFVTWEITKVYFFTWVSWSQRCCRNFITCWFINQTNINIWIVCACCLINWQSYIVICIICFVVRLKIPNTKCQTTWSWVSWVSCRNCSWLISKCRTVSIVHSWSCVNTCWKCIWSSDWCQLCSNCCNTVNYWVTCEAVVSDFSHHVVNSVTKALTLFCVSSVCCWCSKQCCWFSNFFLNCCDSSLDFSFSSCISQLSLVVFSDTYKQFCFWNVLIQDSFFIFLSSCFWCSCSCWSCWFWRWRWFWVWTTVAFSVWLAFRSWVHFAKWYRFWDSLWQFCWYRLWYWNWSICTCLSVNWRACRLLACWCYCWSFWSYCFRYWSSAQYSCFRVCQYVMVCSCLAFQSWCCCFFGLSSVSCHCTTCHSTCCCNPFKKGCTWKKRRFFFYILNCYWRSVCATFNNFEKSKVRCCSTKPVFTRFDKFEASHAICFTEFSLVTSKKHIYLLKIWVIS